MRSICLVLLVLSMGAAWAETAPTSDPVLGGALAVLHINDPRWLDRETTQFAATLGIDPAPMRSALAKVLFRSRALDGIDLTRPALLAWRAGPAPLVAIIPLSNRRVFLDNFGNGFGDEAPLIRVGEREGTVVYSQNTNDGLLEYRLLVSDNSAFLARTIEECRALAAKPQQPALNDPPLVFVASSTFLRGSMGGLGAMMPASTDPTLAPMQAKLREPFLRAWGDLIGQVDSFTLEIRPEGENDMRVTGRIQVMPDSPLAVWTGNQRNQPSRLLPLLRMPTTILTVSGNIAWQGQGELVGKTMGELVKNQVGARWTPAAEETWRGIWALADRCGPFASAMDIDLQGGQVRSELRYLADQPRAQEMVSLIGTCGQMLSGIAGEAVTVGSGAGFRQRTPAGVHPLNDTVCLANERYLVEVQSSARDAAQVAGDLLQRAQTLGAPEGVAGVCAMGVNLTPLFRVLAQTMGGAPQPVLPAAEFALVVKKVAPTVLAVETVVPAIKVAQLVRDSGVVQPGK